MACMQAAGGSRVPPHRDDEAYNFSHETFPCVVFLRGFKIRLCLALSTKLEDICAIVEVRHSLLKAQSASRLLVYSIGGVL